MREILFRGIIKNDNSRYKRGQWAVGDLVRLQDGNDGKPHIYGYGEVFAPTVGQYTGLTDKNGIKIFEGDIVKHHRTLWGSDNSDVGVILWCEHTCKFYRTSKFYTVSEIEIWRDTAKNYEVIGNIHDNPELLKEREGNVSKNGNFM